MTKVVERGRYTYYINEEKRTVVCKMRDVYESIFNVAVLKVGVGYYGTGTYELVAKAKCSPEDTWDEVYGCQLAYGRVRKMFDRELLNYLKKAKRDLDSVTEKLNKKLAEVESRLN